MDPSPASPSPSRKWRISITDDPATDAAGKEKLGLRRLLQPPSSPFRRPSFSKSDASESSPTGTTSVPQEQSRTPLSILSKTTASPARGAKRSWRTRVMGKVRWGGTTSSSNTSSSLGDEASSPTLTESTAASSQDSHAVHQLQQELEEARQQINVLEKIRDIQAQEMDDIRTNSSSAEAPIGRSHRTDRLDPRSFLPRVMSSRRKKSGTPERRGWSFHEKKKPAVSIEILEDDSGDCDNDNGTPPRGYARKDSEDHKFEDCKGEMLTRKKKKKHSLFQPKWKQREREQEHEHLQQGQQDDISSEHNLGDDVTGSVSTVEMDTQDLKGSLLSLATNDSTAPCSGGLMLLPHGPNPDWLEDETVHLVFEEEEPEAFRDSLNVETMTPPSEVLTINEPTPMSEMATPPPTTYAATGTADVTVDDISQRLNDSEERAQAYREKLERTQDLVANQFRDLARARRSGQALVNRNLFLTRKLKQFKADQDENMMARSSLLKACIVVSPIFVLCGGMEIFLSTVVLVWMLVEIEATWLSDSQGTLAIDDGDESPDDKRRVREALKRHRRTNKKQRPKPAPKDVPIPTDIVLSKRKGE